MNNINQDQTNSEKKSPRMTYDMEQLWQELKNKPQSVYFISPRLANNKEFIRSIITNFGGWFLQYASEELKKDKELIELSFEKEGRLDYLSLDSQNDLDLASLYLQKTQNLHLCSLAIRDNKELVLLSLQHSFARMKPGMVLSEQMSKIVKSMNKSLFYDEDIKTFILTNWLSGFNYAPLEFKNNDDLMLKAIQINPFALQYASRNFKDNREYVHIALQKAYSLNMEYSNHITSYASKRIRKIIGKIEPLAQMTKWLLKDSLEDKLAKNKTTIKSPKI